MTNRRRALGVAALLAILAAIGVLAFLLGERQALSSLAVRQISPDHDGGTPHLPHLTIWTVGRRARRPPSEGQSLVGTKYRCSSHLVTALPMFSPATTEFRKWNLR
jgi:hypothetical protein